MRDHRSSPGGLSPGLVTDRTPRWMPPHRRLISNSVLGADEGGSGGFQRVTEPDLGELKPSGPGNLPRGGEKGRGGRRPLSAPRQSYSSHASRAELSRRSIPARASTSTRCRRLAPPGARLAGAAQGRRLGLPSRPGPLAGCEPGQGKPRSCSFYMDTGFSSRRPGVSPSRRLLRGSLFRGPTARKAL
jgi:hypothetical protein